MSQYLFQLGRETLVSLAEIQSLLTKNNIPYSVLHQNNTWLQIKTESPIDPNQYINTLGGTISIAELAPIKFDSKNLIEGIITYLDAIVPDGKIVFSLSGENHKKLAIQSKKELKAQGRSVRFIEPKNTATILHNNLLEKQTNLVLFQNSLFVTKGVQQMEDFSKRDYDKPAIDTKSGMLPPKLARIMVNLSDANENSHLLDPFCGSGTVLMEAAHLGIKKLFGRDISAKAIEDTRTNLSWLSQEFNVHPKISLKEEDSQKLKSIEDNTIDAVVSEPYMGKPLHGNEKKEKLRIQAKELGTLYSNTFAALAKVLKPGGTVVFIIPQFRIDQSWLTIDCVEKIKKHGFSVVPLLEKSSSVLYARPKQHVGRMIWKFKKK